MEARAKWDAWTANSGMSQESAKEDYIALVESLAANHA
jgi:acyl-CoA-binding protein